MCVYVFVPAPDGDRVYAFFLLSSLTYQFLTQRRPSPAASSRSGRVLCIHFHTRAHQRGRDIYPTRHGRVYKKVLKHNRCH